MKKKTAVLKIFFTITVLLFAQSGWCDPSSFIGTKMGFRSGVSSSSMTNFEDPVVIVPPEITTRIEVSNRDINRFTCQGGRAVRDVIFSKEKNIIKTLQGPNAYIKFGILQNAEGRRLYMAEPAEIYIICGEEAVNYTVIAVPKNIDAQQIQLSAPDEKIEKNISLFKGIEFEKKIISIIKQGYLNEFPDSYTFSTPRRKIQTKITGINVLLNTVIDIEGEGLRLKIINIDTTSSSPVDVREKMFIDTNITDNPIGIALDYHTVKKGRTTRLFILEQPKKS